MKANIDDISHNSCRSYGISRLLGKVDGIQQGGYMHAIYFSFFFPLIIYVMYWTLLSLNPHPPRNVEIFSAWQKEYKSIGNVLPLKTEAQIMN